MIKKVSKAIISRIKEDYNDGYKFYTDNVPQGLQAPCFSVLCTSSNKTQSLGNRERMTYNMIVRYFGDNWKDVAEALSGTLKCIKIDGLNIRSDTSEYTYSGNIMSIELTYSFHMYESIKDAEGDMSEIKINEGVIND